VVDKNDGEKEENEEENVKIICLGLLIFNKNFYNFVLCENFF
jgi:hypothetical protein